MEAFNQRFGLRTFAVLTFQARPSGHLAGTVT